MKNKVNSMSIKVMCKAAQAKEVLADNRGEGYIDTAVKILIAVVLGALLLAGLYALLNETVLPTLTQRIKDMFNYAG
ncbi:MAG: DUF6133 family protein [Oscillospiraceae bacterium]|nr:DUF6133 family protein [Oscillospiraceae bacterium]MDD4511208.1 DUF6133 family protein [Oscillospiraceae bacterium]